MNSNKLYTPLRYPGGKGKFAPYIAGLLVSNNLVGGHYLEPYAGGAGAAMVLLLDGYVEHVHINDADPAVAAFWRAATKQTSKLIDMVCDEPVNMESWHHWRSVMVGDVKSTSLDKGFATLFMNRTNRSGILKGGVIGGKNQSGNYKIDERFLREKICNRLQKLAKFRKSITVYEEDAYELLRRCHHFLPLKSLIYLDPPYYVKGEGLYRNFYKHDDHLKIANLILSDRFRRAWLVSYDDVQEIRAMYSRSRLFAYDLAYTAQSRYVGSEVMFFSQRLAPPTDRTSELAA